jgi:LSD1 subclass zinc finger protein
MQALEIDGIIVDDDFLSKQAAILRSIEEEAYACQYKQVVTGAWLEEVQAPESALSLKQGNDKGVFAVDDPRITDLYPTEGDLTVGQGQTIAEDLSQTRATGSQAAFNKPGRLKLKSMDVYNDIVTHVGGKRVRVKGLKQAHVAMAKGCATIVGCPACGTILQVPNGTKNLFCTLCESITPMEVAIASLPIHMDERIAQNMQKQEVYIAKVKASMKH